MPKLFVMPREAEDPSFPKIWLCQMQSVGVKDKSLLIVKWIPKKQTATINELSFKKLLTPTFSFFIDRYRYFSLEE